MEDIFIGKLIKELHTTLDNRFNRFLDKAVTTMPEYVDFEVLFTRQEM